MKFQLVVLFISLAAVCGQKPCSAPQKFQAKISAHDYVSRASVNATVAYDAVAKRQRIIENVWVNGTKLVFDTLFLGEAKAIFRFDGQSKLCEKTPITEPWKDLGLPADAVLVSRNVIGSESIKDAHIRTNLWQYNFDDAKGNKVVSFELWSEVSCLPIDFAHFSKEANVNMVKRFFDIEIGISNEKVWEVREECLNV